MDAAVWVVLILAAVALVFGVLFRHKIKLALQGPGGAGLTVEGENERKGQGPAPGSPPGTGSRNVHIGRDANRSNIVTGDRNRVG